METFTTLILTIIVVCFVGSWTFPWLVAWLLKYKFNLNVAIGRVGLGWPYLTLRDVYVNGTGFSVQIDEVALRSSFLSSEVSKLLLVIIRDIRIKKDIGVLENSPVSIGRHKKVFDFQNARVPPVIITVTQFMAVHIHRITVMLLRRTSPEWLVHAAAEELLVDGSIVHGARLLASVRCAAASAKVLKHSSVQPATAQDDVHVVLGEVTFGLALEATMLAQGPLSVEKLSIEIERPQAVINEGFYEFLQEKGPVSASQTTSHRAIETSMWQEEGRTVQGIMRIIPKAFSLKVESTSLTGMRDHSRRDFYAVLQSVSVESTFNPIAQGAAPFDLLMNVDLEELAVKCNHLKMLGLKKFSFNGKVVDECPMLNVLLDTFAVTYIHKDIHKWVFTNFNKQKTKSQPTPSRGLHARRPPSPWLSELLARCKANVELRTVAVALQLSETHHAGIGFSHTHLSLQSDTLDDQLVELQPWSGELQIEALWCRLGQPSLTSPDAQAKRQHVWGTPVYIGVFRLQLMTPFILKAMLDCVRFEWSVELARFLEQGARCVMDYKPLVPPKSRQSPSDSSKLAENVLWKEHSASLSISNVNIFLMAYENVCIMTRLDLSKLESSSNKLSVTCEGAKAVTMYPSENYYNCIRCEELKGGLAYLKMIRTSYKITSKEFNIQVIDEINANWSTNIHLKLMNLTREIQGFLVDFKEVICAENAPEISAPPKEKRSFAANIRVKGILSLAVTVSTRHAVQFISEDLTVELTQNSTCVQCQRGKIVIDGADTFIIDGLHVAKIADNEEIRLERANNENFAFPWNKTWGVTIRSLCVRFPYQHNFTEAIQNEFVSLYKWLKLVHRYQKKPFTADSPLPSDLLIKVQEFVFEMSDDPFEVKLRDNYELLEDEYQESLKRQKMLDAKVEELVKAHLLLPAGKVDELYTTLDKKNAEIYIQRSKQLNQASPQRTRLFAWVMQEVEILAMADPSIHGKERVVSVMREIDEDSPWPDRGLEFSTLWCRAIRTSCREWKFLLRDFPQPLLHIRSMLVWGRLVGAEQEATSRAKRTCFVELGEPWGKEIIERSMNSLKFYHDFSCDVEHFSYAFGPCWEPVIAQCNLSFERISRPSRDPSPPMPFWDKMRLLYHGRLTMSIQQLTVLLHASLDPYNTTEEMELTWSEVVMDWTTGKFVFKGDLNVYVRTASKYDDCRLLHLPNLKLTIKLNWVCLGDPNDHHAVLPCAPDKLPEYSSNQIHDSFRAFRSQNVNASIALETKPASHAGALDYDFPVALLYGSTLRWFESLKLILSGVTRPTRRGTQFCNVRPRKLQLSRHYRKIHLLLGLHRFQVCYWMSFAMQRGFELIGGRVSSSSEHILNLVPIGDGLKHRPRAEWSIVYMNCELNDAQIWLQTALQEEPGKEQVSMRQPVEKCYFLSLAKVSYGRETSVGQEMRPQNNPHHRLVVYDLKGAWTKSNREVAFALFDSFVKTKQLKKNLSTEALKGFRGETSTPMKSRPHPAETAQITSPSSALQQATPSPMTKLQSGHAATMLQQLIAEAENKAVVFSDDLSPQTREQLLQGLAACHEDDVLFENWHIVLVNSQVLLKGCETKGYVIMSAAKAQILQRIHRPAWKQHTLVTKSTWVGSLECMQYYATVSAGKNDSLDENIMWLTVDNIEEKDSTVIAELPDVPHIVGSGQSVGGVVSETVGASTEVEDPPLQLQRIVSRCKCEFFYAGYGEDSMDPGALERVPPPPTDDGAGPWEQKETAVDAFTLMHYDLDVCTNSLQYAMILDIVNNLLLHVEPRRKEASEKLQLMRFQMQLNNLQDQRRPIQQVQNQVRSLVSKLRRLEKKTHQVHNKLSDDPGNVELQQEMEALEQQVFECKELLNSQSDELNMMISCFKESQISGQKMATMKGDKPLATVRANEICFKHAQWRLTEADGQLGIADLVLSNFLYTKNSRSDDSVEHLLELGYVRMTNLLPNQAYSEVLSPTEIQINMPVDQKRAVRVFCREKAPVGGISVKEHFEINVVPLTIGLTKQFYNTMLKFCFPERDPNSIDADDELEADGKGGKKIKGKKGKDTNFYVRIDRKDDVEKMKERADKNKLFIYIKIPEVPVKVSYKGSKEKNLEDIRDFSLTIPTLEYHNVTWTWLDLLLAMKSDSRRVILSQAIKQKLQIKMTRTSTEERASPQEEDKARMLFGARLMPGDSSRGSLKKSIFKTSK